MFASLLTTLAMFGISEEAFRWTTERLPRARYVAGYYQRWLATLEQIVLDRGVLAPGELDADLAGQRGSRPGAAGPASPDADARVRSHWGGGAGPGRAAAPVPAG